MGVDPDTFREMVTQLNEMNGMMQGMSQKLDDISKMKNNHESRVHHLEMTYVTREELNQLRKQMEKQDEQQDQKIDDVKNETTINTVKLWIIVLLGTIVGGGAVTFFFTLLSK